jgi:TPR repeat protein
LISAKHFFAAYELQHNPAIVRFFNTLETAFPETHTIEKNADPEILFYTGVQALAGIGQPVHRALAFTYIEAAAQAGYSRAQWMLGTLYEAGRGFPPDAAQAAHWYRLAAPQGNATATASLRHMYEMNLVPISGEHLQCYRADFEGLKIYEALPPLERLAETGNFEAKYHMSMSL